jgi:uncharacterized phage protein (TIGR02216 family)
MTDNTGAYPWRRVKEIGMGVLGWPPESFWLATPAELTAALDGYLMRIGARRASAAPPLTRDEVAALRRRFPDQVNPVSPSI